MGHIQNFNIKINKPSASQSEKILSPNFNNIKTKKSGYKPWANFFSYYRYYLDKFATDILKVNLYPFQKLILRACAKYGSCMLIMSRGLGKSWLMALYAVIYAILYPKSQIGVVSGTLKQSKILIENYIVGKFMLNPNIGNEIECKKSPQGEARVEFKNGSNIFSIALNQSQAGDSARGNRTNLVLVDEARGVKDSIISLVVEPMGNNKRENLIIQEEFAKAIDPTIKIRETNKIMYMSSAWFKTSDLYKRFLLYYEKMSEGSKDYFVTSLDYVVGIKSGLYFEDKIEKEWAKPTTTKEGFLMEYCGQFVGSSSDSYYPYELTKPCRVLQKGELIQSKISHSEYVLTHDVAVSGAKGSDNCCTHIIKISLRLDGNYNKEVVYTKTQNGLSLQGQRDFIRNLYHIKFPNCRKIVIDAQSVGEGLLSSLCETWQYENDKGEFIEFPPLIVDNDEELAKLMPDALPIIRGIKAYEAFNNDYYSYTKACFENGTLKLLIDSSESIDSYKADEIDEEQQALHIEHDILVQELSNICEVISPDSSRKVFRRIVATKKRDRATSLIYGLSYIAEIEKESKANLYRKKENYDISSYLGFY